MSRTSDGNVGKIIDIASGDTLDGEIATATLLVDDIASCDSSVSAARLEIIERWLAAHYYAVRKGKYESKKTQDASAKFQGKTGMRIDSTFWGQQAISLDPTGCLLRQSKGKNRIQLHWLGTEAD